MHSNVMKSNTFGKYWMYYICTAIPLDPL